MVAGLPGVGLSGAFFIVSAFVMLPLEIMRTLRGRSSIARWATVLRHVATAITMIGALELCYAALHFTLKHLSSLLLLVPGLLVDGHTTQTAVTRGTSPASIPLLPVLGTLVLVIAVIGTAKAAALLSRARRGAEARATS